MAKRTEAIEINEIEVKEVISAWLTSKYGPGWVLSLGHFGHEDLPIYFAKATREVKD